MAEFGGFQGWGVDPSRRGGLGRPNAGNPQIRPETPILKPFILFLEGQREWQDAPFDTLFLEKLRWGGGLVPSKGLRRGCTPLTAEQGRGV